MGVSACALGGFERHRRGVGVRLRHQGRGGDDRRRDGDQRREEVAGDIATILIQTSAPACVADRTLQNRMSTRQFSCRRAALFIPARLTVDHRRRGSSVSTPTLAWCPSRSKTWIWPRRTARWWSLFPPAAAGRGRCSRSLPSSSPSAGYCSQGNWQGKKVTYIGAFAGTNTPELSASSSARI